MVKLVFGYTLTAGARFDSHFYLWPTKLTFDHVVFDKRTARLQRGRPGSSHWSLLQKNITGETNYFLILFELCCAVSTTFCVNFSEMQAADSSLS